MSSEHAVPGEVLRARRTAAGARAAMALCAIALALFRPALAGHPAILILGFAVVLLTAAVQLVAPSARWSKLEESFATVAAVLIVGLGDERVSILSFLWVAAVACGVLARGGRQHWLGRTLLLGSLALPIAIRPGMTASYAALCVVTLALLLTCGRVTQELRALLGRARWDADHDALTGALVRAAFRDRLDAAAADLTGDSDELGAVVFDLDDFGSVNKLRGHAAGDALLVSVIERVTTHLGTHAVIGRLGGDEFAVFVPGADPESVGRGIIAALTADSGDLRGVHASVGVASLPRDGKDAETALRAADIALRLAKQNGRQQFVQYAGHSLSDPGPSGARGALHRLIDGDGLAIAVQPIVDPVTGAIHAYEALARFKTRGESSPLHWFALADEFGLRDELEIACLQRALDLFRERPPGTLLTVNLSGPLLGDPRVRQLLESQPTIRGLIIEVTENSLIQDTDQLGLDISSLVAAGVRFAIDDVGAGYSGLRQMTVLHPTYIKLDRSLVQAIDGDPGRVALLRAFANYAAETNSYLVAEGVETDTELAALIHLGVPLVQGFLLARPGPPWPPVDGWQSLSSSADVAADGGPAPRTYLRA